MLRGHQIGLGPVEEEDLSLLVRWHNDPKSQSMFLMPFLPSYGRKKWYEALLNDRGQMQFMIVRLQDDVPVGTVGLKRIDYRHQQAKMSPLVVDPSCDVHEIAVDAVTVLIRYAFMDLNLHRLYIELLASDQPAYDIAATVGFQSEGTYRQAAFVNGEFQDVQLVAILREEWQDNVT
jgi:RimJ/RimL family protein N-acetyltransferase